MSESELDEKPDDPPELDGVTALALPDGELLAGVLRCTGAALLLAPSGAA